MPLNAVPGRVPVVSWLALNPVNAEPFPVNVPLNVLLAFGKLSWLLYGPPRFEDVIMPSPIVGLFAGPVIVMGGAALALLSPDTNEEGVNWTSTSGAWLLVVLSLLSMVIETELPAEAF